MRIHLETTFLIKDILRIYKLHRLTKDKRHEITIYPSGHASYLMLACALNTKLIRSVNLVINGKQLTNTLVYCLNHSTKLNIMVTSEPPKCISKAKRQIYTSKEINESSYLNALSCNDTSFDCKFSSCLGKTICLDKKDNLYFCPHHRQASFIGTLKTTSSLWDNPEFTTVLTNAIAARNDCKANCKLYKHCHGGCPLDNKCQEYKEQFEASERDMTSLIKARTPLDSLPIYKADSIINYLSYHMVRTKDGKEEKL